MQIYEQKNNGQSFQNSDSNSIIDFSILNEKTDNSFKLLRHETIINSERPYVMITIQSKLDPKYYEMYITNYRIIFNHLNISLSIPYGFIKKQLSIQNNNIKIILKSGLKVYIKLDNGLKRVISSIKDELNRLPFCYQYTLTYKMPIIYDSLAQMQRMRIDWTKYQIVNNIKGQFCLSYPRHLLIPKLILDYSLKELSAEITVGLQLYLIIIILLLSHCGEVQNSRRRNAQISSIKHLAHIDLSKQITPKQCLLALDNLRMKYERLVISYAKNEHLLSSLSEWYSDIDLLLESAYYCYYQLKNGRNVLVQEMYSFDRTPQVCALVGILIDPFYRTFQGLSILIEREFISFGHPFANRIGFKHTQQSEIAPIFIQFLECIHQLINSHPQNFQYSAKYLAQLAYQTYTTKYHNFLYNNCQEQIMAQLLTQITSNIWKSLPMKKQYKNQMWREMYSIQLPDLRKKPSIKQYLIWKQYFDLLVDLKCQTEDD